MAAEGRDKATAELQKAVFEKHQAQTVRGCRGPRWRAVHFQETPGEGLGMNGRVRGYTPDLTDNNSALCFPLKAPPVTRQLMQLGAHLRAASAPCRAPPEAGVCTPSCFVSSPLSVASAALGSKINLGVEAMGSSNQSIKLSPPKKAPDGPLGP